MDDKNIKPKPREERETDTPDTPLLPWQQRIKDAVEMTLKEYGVTREEITARHKNLTVNITRRK